MCSGELIFLTIRHSKVAVAIVETTETLKRAEGHSSKMNELVVMEDVTYTLQEF